MSKPKEKVVAPKKLTLRERKKAQPDAQIYFSEAERGAIIKTVASNLTPAQVQIFFYQCQALGLNPLLNEICAIPYAGKLSIQVMRDGFLKIAHRSGKFAGIRSGVKGDKELVGWAKVYHKDFKQPVYQEADLSEYNNTKNALWKTKPKTMIKKVAESMALRKAFNVSGVYAPEEMELELEAAKKPEIKMDNPDRPATEAQLKTIESLTKGDKTEGAERHYTLTTQEAAEKIKELAERKK